MPIIDIDTFANNVNVIKQNKDDCSIIGIDPGKKRIGIAICNINVIIALPLCTIQRHNIKWHELSNKLRLLFIQYRVSFIIIGNPMHMNGNDSRGSQSAKDFAINIANNFDIPICLWDERCSTIGVKHWTINNKTNSKKIEDTIDSHAAAFILEGAMQYIMKTNLSI